MQYANTKETEMPTHALRHKRPKSRAPARKRAVQKMMCAVRAAQNIPMSDGVRAMFRLVGPPRKTVPSQYLPFGSDPADGAGDTTPPFPRSPLDDAYPFRRGL